MNLIRNLFFKEIEKIERNTMKDANESDKIDVNKSS